MSKHSQDEKNPRWYEALTPSVGNDVAWEAFRDAISMRGHVVVKHRHAAYLGLQLLAVLEYISQSVSKPASPSEVKILIFIPLQETATAGISLRKFRLRLRVLDVGLSDHIDQDHLHKINVRRRTKYMDGT